MLSIIIPAYNEKENLGRLLPKLREMMGSAPVEIIVSLSCENSDGSQNIASNPRVLVLECGKKGRAAQMNEAVKKSEGRILVFLHADVTPLVLF